jgi:hypothetical protein
MRLIAFPIYRAFPELDGFDDERCRMFVRHARASPARNAVRIAVRIAACAVVVAAGTILFRTVWQVDAAIGWYVLALAGLLGGAALSWLVFRDIQLRLAIRRLFRRGARCASCSYSLAGLPVSAQRSICCPECGLVVDLSPFPECIVTATDGSLRFLPSGRLAFAPVPFWTKERRRACLRGAAVAVSVPLVLAGFLLGAWEIRLRSFASKSADALRALPPAASVLDGALPRAGSGANAIDLLSDFDRALGSTGLDDLRVHLSQSRSWLYLGSVHLRDASDDATLEGRFMHAAAESATLARDAGLLDLLTRIARAPVVRFPTVDSEDGSLSALWAARIRTFWPECRNASALAADWLADACARGDAADAGRAFEAAVALETLHGLIVPGPHAGNLAQVAPFLDMFAAVLQRPGGEEALGLAENAMRRRAASRTPSEDMTAILVRKEQEYLASVFGRPELLRWAVVPGFRPAEYSARVGRLWQRGGPLPGKDPPPHALDFDSEWDAASKGYAQAVRGFLSEIEWQRGRVADENAGASSRANAHLLPPLAEANALWLYHYSPGVTMDRVSEAAAVVVLAIERFRRDTGRLPGSLAELVPNHLAAEPRAEVRLFYRPAPDPQIPPGYRLYSAGWDGNDDGGDPELDMPIVGCPPPPPRGN